MALLGIVLAHVYAEHRRHDLEPVQLPGLSRHLSISHVWPAAPDARQRRDFRRLLHAIHWLVLLLSAAPVRRAHLERPVGSLASVGVESGADCRDGLAAARL